MSARRHPSPPDLASRPRPEDGQAALQRELKGESAAALGRLGRAVETALGRLRALEPGGDPARRTALLYECGDAVWRYFVQREACGLRNHLPAIEAYGIPREVLAKVGASPPVAPTAPARTPSG